MKKKKIKIVISLLVVLFVGCLGAYYYVNNVAPVQFVQSYLEARYDQTDYLNITEKSNAQKNKMDPLLLGIDYKFSDFNSYIEEFANFKLRTSLKDANIYKVEKVQDIISIKVKVHVFFKSDVMEDWAQETFYDLNILLKRQGFGKYKINYIKELDSHIELMDDDGEEYHNHHSH